MPLYSIPNFAGSSTPPEIRRIYVHALSRGEASQRIIDAHRFMGPEVTRYLIKSCAKEMVEEETLLCEMCTKEVPVDQAYQWTNEVPLCSSVCLENWMDRNG